jgi:hypothetical protein
MIIFGREKPLWRSNSPKMITCPKMIMVLGVSVPHWHKARMRLFVRGGSRDGDEVLGVVGAGARIGVLMVFGHCKGNGCDVNTKVVGNV